jgi:hypothetical protein
MEILLGGRKEVVSGIRNSGVAALLRGGLPQYREKYGEA